MNPFFSQISTKTEIINKLGDNINLKEYDDTFNITLISRFEGRKCQDRLIRAFEKFVNRSDVTASLFLAGNTSIIPNSDTDYRYELFQNIPHKLSKHIHFFDFLSLAQQDPFVAITDLVIMPSTFENQPMAMIETVLRDIPVIASKYSGCADYISKEMLFDPFDENDLQNKIYSFYKLSKEQRFKCAQAQKKQLLNILNPETCILPRFSLKPCKNISLNQDMSELYHE